MAETLGGTYSQMEWNIDADGMRRLKPFSLSIQRSRLKELMLARLGREVMEQRSKSSKAYSGRRVMRRALLTAYMGLIRAGVLKPSKENTEGMVRQESERP